MLRRSLISSACGLLLSMLCAPAMAQDQYCDLTAPPANAGTEADHGHYFFIFPDALPEKFSGCKTWWIETGQKYLLFRMTDGRVTEVDMLRKQSEQAAGSAEMDICPYPDGALAKGSPENCLAFENAQSFAEYAVGPDGVKVPAAKDIRTKAPL